MVKRAYLTLDTAYDPGDLVPGSGTYAHVVIELVEDRSIAQRLTMWAQYGDLASEVWTPAHSAVPRVTATLTNSTGPGGNLPTDYDDFLDHVCVNALATDKRKSAHAGYCSQVALHRACLQYLIDNDILDGTISVG